MEELRIINAQSDRDMDEVFHIRQEVFVNEQQVAPEIEYDRFEETSHHYLAFLGKEAAGTARWRKTPNGIKLERFAVLPEFRKKGVASAIIKEILGQLPDNTNVYLHSQIQVSSLYERFGFKKEGEQFEEAGIQHYKMVLRD
jgi:predicted GNAT family N-acyltransferase